MPRKIKKFLEEIGFGYVRKHSNCVYFPNCRKFNSGKYYAEIWLIWPRDDVTEEYSLDIKLKGSTIYQLRDDIDEVLFYGHTQKEFIEKWKLYFREERG